MKQIKITVKDETYDEISRLAEKKSIAPSVMAKLLLIDGLGQRKLWDEISRMQKESEEAVMRMVKEQDEMIRKIAPEMLRKQKEYEEAVMRMVKEQDEMIKEIAPEQAKRISENTERLKKNKRA